MNQTEKSQRILIVEDDSGISDFINLELQHEGFETSVAATGRQALEQFESFNPDLILLDVMLPELSGLEVVRRIRKTSSVPVIMITARGETYDRVNGLDAGADDYIPKPFEIEELLARMRAVLRRMTKVENSPAVLKLRDIEIIPDETILSKEFLFLALKYGTFEKEVHDKAFGAAMPALSFSMMNDIPVVVPMSEQQSQFVSFVEQTDKSKVAVQKALDEAQLLFDSLMQKYFG